MQCAALARETGLRCKLEAEPGSIFCRVPQHKEGWPVAESARQELGNGSLPVLQEEPDGPDPGPGAGGSRNGAPPTHSERDRADFSDPSDLQPSALDPFSGLERHGGPAAEASARPHEGSREVDPSIFELEDGPPPGAGEDGGRVAGHIGPGGAGVPGPGPADTLLERFPGPLGERDGKRLQRAVCNRLFEQYGKDRLTPDEEEFGGEAWAAVANYYLAQVDPNSPWGAWFLAVAVTAGPRFLPDVWDGISRRVRGEDPRPDPDPGAEPPPSSPEVDEPRDEGHRPSGWTALEGLPE